MERDSKDQSMHSHAVLTLRKRAGKWVEKGWKTAGKCV